MGGRYAVLISGGFADRDGYDEFWNDLVRIWKVLIDSGYRDENIFILYGDGSDYEDSGRPLYSFKRYKLLARSVRKKLTDFPADRSSVEYIFKALAGSSLPIIDLPVNSRLSKKKRIQRLTGNDSLFIWTFNHGDRIDGDSYLGLINGESIMDKDFSRLVGRIVCSYKVICMQQCFCGGFIDNLEEKRNLVLTACAADEIANRADTENEIADGVIYHHGEFNHHFYTALSAPGIKKIIQLQMGAADEFERMRKVFNFVFKFISNNSSRAETTQYFDGYYARSDDSMAVTGGIQEDILKSSWTLGNDGGSICLDFTYDIKNVGASLSAQRIKTEVKVDGVLKETFEFTSNGQSFLIDIEAEGNHYGMFGQVISNYTDKTIVFDGSIISKLDTYCASQSYSSDGIAIDATGYSCIVFKWI